MPETGGQSVVYAQSDLRLLPSLPPRRFASTAEEDFWRGVATEPRQTVSALRQRYRELEYRLQRLERVVTSEDVALRRRFRDLGS